MIRSDISPDLKDLLQKCLQIDPNTRVAVSDLHNTNYIKRLKSKYE
jgi:serine/threonine protein kinase